VVTDDGRFLVLYGSLGADPRTRQYYRPIDSTDDIIRLLDDADASYQVIDSVGSTLYVQTDHDAPKGRVVAIDLTAPDRANWREIIPESTDTIDYVAMVNNRLVVVTLRDAHHVMTIYSLDGALEREVPLPGIGSVGGLSGKRDDTAFFFAFTSFLFPTTIFRYDFLTDTVTPFRQSEFAFDPTPYQTTQAFVTSRDGARVPIFITARRDAPRDGSNPTLLYGYGGFNVSLTPVFQPELVPWFDAGGVYVMANLRGGGEYGEAWHQAGMLANKQNVFNDFLAVADWLIANGYTRPDKLAIQGASNGGLLVAACMVQRPDLFGAVVCQVPVTDMLRYHKPIGGLSAHAGRYWIPEYGNADEDPDLFRAILAYSPLHNVTDGVRYPPILIMTADHDDRVVPAHALKFAARLQAADPENPLILLRVETKAGHGAGKPLAKVIEEDADIYAFLARALGVSFG
ncbi:MAG: prolyl oligopeptidase family serine peptidase, partial [Dehalococcoidia bacterium]|nr:prolyl oligopeptidase family serine peptidase [Dehalococcoidia bacterium]